MVMPMKKLSYYTQKDPLSLESKEILHDPISDYTCSWGL